MRIYCISAGTVCALYYLIIVLYTRRWNSTFARFWPFAGLIHIAIGIFAVHPIAQRVFSTLLIAFWIIFLFVEINLIRYMFLRTRNGLPYIIVLGAQVRGRKITNSLKRRLDKALDYLKENPAAYVIVSGGQGPGEDISEAAAMAQYLHEHGIDKTRIIEENTSTSTWENLIYSMKYIKDNQVPAGIVTNNFHIYRALKLGQKAGYTHLYGLPASSNPVLLLNYMVREFFAIIRMKGRVIYED